MLSIVLAIGWILRLTERTATGLLLTLEFGLLAFPLTLVGELVPSRLPQTEGAASIAHAGVKTRFLGVNPLPARTESRPREHGIRACKSGTGTGR